MTKLVRLVTVAFALLLAFAAPQVLAQTGRQSDKEKKNVMVEKSEAEAYRSAVDRIPDATTKYDPWGNMRGTPEAVPTKKK